MEVQIEVLYKYLVAHATNPELQNKRNVPPTFQAVGMNGCDPMTSEFRSHLRTQRIFELSIALRELSSSKEGENGKSCFFLLGIPRVSQINTENCNTVFTFLHHLPVDRPVG